MDTRYVVGAAWPLTPDGITLLQHGWVHTRFPHSNECISSPDQKYFTWEAHMRVDITTAGSWDGPKWECHGIETITIREFDPLFNLLNFSIPGHYLFERAIRGIAHLAQLPIMREVHIHVQFVFLQQSLPESLCLVYSFYKHGIRLMRRDGDRVLDELGVVDTFHRKNQLIALQSLGNLRRQRIDVCLTFLVLALDCSFPVINAVFRTCRGGRRKLLPDPIERMPLNYRYTGPVIESW
jgi:hypothetical protein